MRRTLLCAAAFIALSTRLAQASCDACDPGLAPCVVGAGGYATISLAVADPACQGIVVEDGFYHEQVTIDRPGVVLSARNPHAAVLFTSTGLPVLRILADDVCVQGMHIEAHQGWTGDIVRLQGASRVVFRDNEVSGSSSHGDLVSVFGGSGSTLCRNDLYSGVAGLEMESTADNLVFCNRIASCQDYQTMPGGGIVLRPGTSGNSYFNNNLLNTENLTIFGPLPPSTWDDGAGHGNFWTDYRGTDLDGDGIGDTNLPHLSVDSFPLMIPADLEACTPVVPANCPPSCHLAPFGPLGCDRSASPNCVLLDASGSSDPEAAPLTFSWQNDPATPTAVVFDSPAAAVTLACIDPSVTPVGGYQVHLRVSDGDADCSLVALLTYQDCEGPTLKCAPPEIVAADGICVGRVAGGALDPLAEDACDPVVDVQPIAPTDYPLGTTLLSFTATDDSGHTDHCSTAVTVVDSTPPVPAADIAMTGTCAAFQIDAVNRISVPVFTVTYSATDNCDPTPVCTAVLTQANLPTTCCPLPTPTGPPSSAPDDSHTCAEAIPSGFTAALYNNCFPSVPIGPWPVPGPDDCALADQAVVSAGCGGPPLTTFIVAGPGLEVVVNCRDAAGNASSPLVIPVPTWCSTLSTCGACP